MTPYLRFSLCFLLVVSGCTTQQPVTEDPPADHNALRIAERLELAENARRSNRLTTPEDDNAYLHYLSVLALDPDNALARDGINSLIEQYLAWARDVAEEGRYRQARQYVARARAIDESHPNLAPVLKMIDERERRITVRYDLNRQAVRMRLADQIRFDQMAGQIERSKAFVTIRAPDDATGRWIYQQLNERVSFRIEASFLIDGAPAVELAR